MRMPWKNEPGVISMLIALGMTLLGAVASYAYRVLSGDKFSWRTLCLQIIVAMFAGLLMALIASYYGWPVELTGCSCGLSGWAGQEFIKALDRRFLSKVSGEEGPKVE
ncbi:phage holin family protein [Kluyvera ascorbata]|uniref:phage holin family protein n=1 Tax=Kluyvera ascorbata TaxID=51288 RepID=UPI00205AAD30|nr:phage holin family protein [Kluyvera ascorbata]UPQ70551.1 phage holin family protein [Kluyvera ascorbata]